MYQHPKPTQQFHVLIVVVTTFLIVGKLSATKLKRKLIRDAKCVQMIMLVAENGALAAALNVSKAGLFGIVGILMILRLQGSVMPVEVGLQ